MNIAKELRANQAEMARLQAKMYDLLLKQLGRELKHLLRLVGVKVKGKEKK